MKNFSSSLTRSWLEISASSNSWFMGLFVYTFISFCSTFATVSTFQQNQHGKAVEWVEKVETLKMGLQPLQQVQPFKLMKHG